MHRHLFSSVFNSILTIVTLYIIFITVRDLWTWGIADAVWIAESRRECFDISLGGACWAGVIGLDGQYYLRALPTRRIVAPQSWTGCPAIRIWMAPLWLPRVKAKILIGLTVVFLYPFMAGYLFAGGDKGIFMQIMVTAAIVCA